MSRIGSSDKIYRLILVRKDGLNVVKKRRAKRGKKEGICGYCGKITQLSEDHVIPQCLFAGKCPSDTPTIYACERYNNILKSGNDIYLRDMLFMDMHSAQHPIVQQLWEKFKRAVSRNQSPAAKHALSNGRYVRLHTVSGIFREWAYEMNLPLERVTDILGMMTRGLYQYYVGRKLPQYSQFEVMRIQGDLQQFETTIQVLLQLGAPFVTVGDGEVFQCIYACSAAHPEVSLWFLCFYNSVVFSVVTNRQVSQQASSSDPEPAESR